MTIRITELKALELYGGASLHDLGEAAHRACCARHGEDYRTFVIDRNVNYTNICQTRCRFCAFSTDAEAADAYVLSRDVLLAKVDELVRLGGTQVLLQGGMHPQLSLEWYEGILRDLREAFPRVHLHAFSPPEIWFFHMLYGLPLATILDRLQAAGMDTIPGGGAEILVDRVRRIVSPRKCNTGQWLEVMRQAHALGMRTTATMMFGHIESDAERIEHLRQLRQLQDESLDKGKGHFTAFICWTFQPANTDLGRSMAARETTAAAGPAASEAPPVRAGAANGHLDSNDEVHLAGAVTYLRTLAVARLYLDNFDNLQASWVTQGPKVGQLALFYGANDMGGTMMEENVVSAAGTAYHMTPDEVRRLIRDAGWQARQRNCYYQLVD